MVSSKNRLHLRLFGAFSARWSDGRSVDIRGNKQRALIAVLATAAAGKHTRGWLQETIWGRSGAKHGRANLRRMLSDLKTIFAADFERLFVVDHADIQIKLDLIELEGDIRDGDFLAGVDIFEDGFRSWLHEKRELYRNAPVAPKIITTETLPTVTIIPFLSIHQTDMERHLSDVVALEVSRALSRSTMINVISHLSSREFSGKLLSLNDVKQNLNVDYLTTGTIRANEKEFSIDVDFIDATSGKINWTRNFTGKFDDIFQNQRGTAYEIASQVGQGILSASVELARTQPLPDVSSHALLMSAINWLHSNDIGKFKKSYEFMDELIQQRRIKNSILHAWKAFWHLHSVPQGWSTNTQNSTKLAIECANRALDINPNCAFALTMEGMASNRDKQERVFGLSKLNEALAIEPNSALAWLLKARHYAFSDQGQEAIESADRAIGLSPIGPQRYLFETIAAAAFLVGNEYEKALELANRSLSENASHRSSLRAKAVALEKLGQLTEAELTVKKLLSVDPLLTVKRYLDEHPAANQESGKSWAASLQRAGLPAN